MSARALLCILDGIGLNPRREGNAVALAQTPTLDRIQKNFPSNTLVTFGPRVGLPENQMGNSEVGHLNIGAGRVVEQWLELMRKEFQRGAVAEKPAYKEFISAQSKHSQVHLVGLLSQGGVHSHIQHLHQLLDLLKSSLSNRIILHLITDGRDTSPTAALEEIKALENKLENNSQITICSVSGRYYAMDRDKRWDRTELFYRAVCDNAAKEISSLTEYIQASYEKGLTDEFLKPAILHKSEVQTDDSFIFFNFRSDRMRQIVRAICDPEFSHFERSAPIPQTRRVLCFTRYEEDFPYPFLFKPMQIKHHLGQVVSEAGLKQIRIAETEKYPHVTYFLNGMQDQVSPGEEHSLIPSPRDVTTYDQKPEMSAPEVTAEVIKALESEEYHLIVVNFANGDMVGHTGVLQAAIEAVETVDSCLNEVLHAASAHDTSVLVLADHGNAEQMVEYDTGEPHTAHTTYPVPIVVIGKKEIRAVKDGGALCDIAPTLLELMNISKPEEMTGESLLVSE